MRKHVKANGLRYRVRALPFLEFPECSRLYTVCAPRRVSHLVADADAEPSKVASDQVDHCPLLTLDVQARTLAPVFCPSVGRAWKIVLVLDT